VPIPNLSHWDKPLGQAPPVPVGQADWDRLCLPQWDRLCLSQTCPTGNGKGQKRPVLVPWISHIPTLEACPCRRTSPTTTMEPVPVQLVPTCHKVGLQGRGNFFKKHIVHDFFSKTCTMYSLFRDRASNTYKKNTGPCMHAWSLCVHHGMVMIILDTRANQSRSGNQLCAKHHEQTRQRSCALSVSGNNKLLVSRPLTEIRDNI